MTPSSADLSLPAALRACARGLYPLEAGVDLLISHACWLHREDFQDNFIHAGISIADGVTAMAEIGWPAAISTLDARHLPCSGEQRRLRLAASLAGGIPVSLRDTLTGIDHRNIELVITAVLHAWGQRPEPEIP